MMFRAAMQRTLPGSFTTNFPHTSLDNDLAKLKVMYESDDDNVNAQGRNSPLSPQCAIRLAAQDDNAQCKILNELILLEVNPGFCVRLRGLDESWRAFRTALMIMTRCTCCSALLGSVPDAEFVLCPECRFISLAGNKASHFGGGLALGINVRKITKPKKRYTSYEQDSR